GVFLLSIVSVIDNRNLVSAAAADYIGKVENPISGTPSDAGGIVTRANKVITFVTAMAAAALLVTIIINGITIIRSDKSAEAFATAMKNIMYSILGMLLVGFSYVIALAVTQMLFGSGTNYLNSDNWFN
ncbi:hypothetical protein IJJ12_00135, partial [bacterium]|nr:hypothetical protein [bacterium]